MSQLTAYLVYPNWIKAKTVCQTVLTRRAMFAGDWKPSQSAEAVLLSTKSVRFIVVGRAGFPKRLRRFGKATGEPWMDALCFIPHRMIEQIIESFIYMMQPVS